EGLPQWLAFVLDGKVDQRGGSTESRGPGSGFKVVGAGGAAEGHIQMGMNIDAAGKHILPRGLKNSLSILAGEILADGRNFAICDSDVGHVSIRRGDHRSVADN